MNHIINYGRLPQVLAEMDRIEIIWSRIDPHAVLTSHQERELDALDDRYDDLLSERQLLEVEPF